MKNRVLIYIDGAARGNPGPSGIGVIIKDQKGVIIKKVSKFLGEATNNIAEYNALLTALKEAKEMGFSNIIIYSDSELLINQLLGEYKVKNSNLKELFENAIELINGFDNVEFEHIEREFNKEADKLANKAINLSGLNKIF